MSGSPPASGDPAGDPATAQEVWLLMRDLVFGRGDHRRAASEELGMGYSRIKAMLHLEPGELAHHELAAELLTDKPYTTVIIRDLLERGLVESRPHPSDGRSKLVSLTPAGREQAERARRIVVAPPEEMSRLSTEDLAQLRRILSLLTPE
ncbi:MarR family winged helix-turn-helix transcriptional regulator [Spongisporangium articulatum]|uniref:MarR family winged helix-turn-helix transcriptional regulator n=1 Tax=Spongisporangium articulatum TaxID=3362603 RepID=A0ABW8AR38_9ACTN